MVRGVCIHHVVSEKMFVKDALDRYVSEISTTKRASTACREEGVANQLKRALGKYRLAALSPDVIAEYRDPRLGQGLSAISVRIELALLSHRFTIAIKAWRSGPDLQPGL